MKPIPPTILICDTDFANAWARAVGYVLRDGVQIVIGDTTEPKPIRDICATIELTGDAITQIENHELHPQFPFKHIGEYCSEFTYKFQKKYMNQDSQQLKFSYTYFDRIVNSPSRLLHEPNINQLISLREHLRLEIKNSISSNRDQAITWKTYIDIESTATPCLQRIWIRYLGDQSVEVHLTWRSRDLHTAWQANLIALIDMLNREVIHRNNCRIVKLVDYNDSLHIYDSDIAAAKGVRLVPVNPQKHRSA